MSFIKVIIRCDHGDCTATTDLLANPFGKWMRRRVALTEHVLLSSDYCPAHAHMHVADVECES